MPDEKEKERKFAKDFLEKWTRAEREEGPADEALVRVDEALRAAPDDPKLWFRRASILTDLERWGEALEAFHRVEAIDPAFPRLFVGLSFVLARLGRTEEAAEAQRRSLGAVGLGLGPERDAEQALEALAEDLRKESTEEEAGKALDELRTIVGAEPVPEAPEQAPGGELAPEEDLESKLARWAAAGYDVAPLREIMDHEPDRTRTAFFQFEQNIRKVEVLRETVDALPPEGLEGDIARVRDLFLAPYQIWRIEAEMATLLEKADARDRAARARLAPPPPAVPRRAPAVTPRAPAPGRINGLINGTGRVNGMAQGRVNGLINGVVRARAGLTNGLTNGLGFTNGLGGRRYAGDQRRRWARVLLIPLVAFSLLSVTLFLPPDPGPLLGGIRIGDGRFDEWQGAVVYTQPSSTSNPDVDLLTYASHFEDRRLTLYAKVRGAIFPDTTGYDVLYAYLDVDGNAATGYDADQLGAEVLVEILGGNGSAMQASSWIWSGTDLEDWSGWSGGGPTVLADALGSEVEFQIDIEAVEDVVGPDTFDEERATMRLVLDDQAGSSSESKLAFGPESGLLEVVQSSAGRTVPAGSADFLLLSLRAIGGAVNVTSATIGLGPGTPSLTPLASVVIQPDEPPVSVALRVDATGLAAQSLLTAEVLSVAADRPVTILGSPARAYVGSLPAGPAADGIFLEWTSVTNDSDASPVPNPNVDIRQHASAARNATAFSYARVVGRTLGDRDAPWARGRPQPGPASAPGEPAPRERRVGEDLFRVFYDANGTAGGAPIEGILADAYIEVRGRHGRVHQAQGYEWQDGWVPRGTAWAVADGDELETRLDLPGRDFRGAAYVVEALDWRRTRDVSDAGGVRGTRGAPSGVSFVGSYEAFLPSTADGWVAFAAGGLDVSWRLPTLWRVGGESRTEIAGPTSAPLMFDDSGGTFRGAYGAGADVAYAAEPDRLKEAFVFQSPPPLAEGEDLLLEFPIRRHADLMVYVTGETIGDEVLVDGPLSFVDGRGLSLTLPPPWIEDAAHARADLRYLWAEGRVGIRLPGAWLRDASYPVVLDPTVTYTLRNQGPSADDGEWFGYSTAIGDFNGDGRADVLVGAPANNLGGGGANGYAYIFMGPFTADDATPDVRFNGGTGSAQLGYSVAAGKFDSDTYWDALIARLSIDGAGTGNVEIYFGSSGWSGLDSGVDVSFTPPAAPKRFGHAVAAGNLDNANYDDVLIGEPGRDLSSPADGAADGVVYVYMSPFSASETASDYRLVPSSGQPYPGGQLGKSLAVGKTDSDAYADIVVGEPNAISNKGRIQWFKGSHFTSGSGDVTSDATIDGVSAGDLFGSSVSVGKVNGDAYADVAVGAPFRSTSTGAAYTFLASSDGTGLSSSATPDATFAGEATSDQFGWSVLLVDFDDDGTAGLAVGANFAAGGGTRRGKFYWYDDPINDGTADETLTGSQTDERFGQSLAAGRFASDPRTVLVIGAYRWDDTAADDDGRAVVAQVPEPAELLVGAVVLIGIGGSLQRRRLVRKR